MASMNADHSASESFAWSLRAYATVALPCLSDAPKIELLAFGALQSNAVSLTGPITVVRRVEKSGWWAYVGVDARIRLGARRPQQCTWSTGSSSGRTGTGIRRGPAH